MITATEFLFLYFMYRISVDLTNHLHTINISFMMINIWLSDTEHPLLLKYVLSKWGGGIPCYYDSEVHATFQDALCLFLHNNFSYNELILMGPGAH